MAITTRFRVRRMGRTMAACRFAFCVPAAILCLLPVAAMAQARPDPAQVDQQTIAATIGEAALRFGVAEDWIRAVLRAESAGNPRALSRVGAMGLMQIMPATWSDLTARFGLGADPFDVRANILAGAAYLRAMRDRYGDLPSTLAAYNAGPRRVDDWRKFGRPLPGETLAYVTRIAVRLSQGASGSVPALPVPARDWRVAGLFSSAGSTTAHASSGGSALPLSDAASSSASSRLLSPKALLQGLFVPRSGLVQP